MFKVLNETELKKLLKLYIFLTSEDFTNPDRSYIFLDKKEEIKFIDIGDIVYNFNFEVFKNSEFRIVQKKFENLVYENEYA